METTVWSDPKVWSTGIAIVALILSQIPPIKQLIKRLRARIGVPNRFNLTHYLGNLNLVLFVDLRNVGGRTFTVSKLLCLVVVPDGRSWILPAQTTISREGSQTPGQQAPEYPVGWITLKPGENWNAAVRFFKSFTPTEEETAADIVSSLMKDIQKKLQTMLPGPGRLAEAEPSLVRKAQEECDRKLTSFGIEKGNYRLVVAAISDKDKVLAVNGFDFTLFASSISALRGIADDYKYGAGVYYPSTDPSKAVWPELRPMEKGKAEATFKNHAAMPDTA